MAEVLTQSGPQVVFHTPRNIKVASCLILIVTIHDLYLYVRIQRRRKQKKLASCRKQTSPLHSIHVLLLRCREDAGFFLLCYWLEGVT